MREILEKVKNGVLDAVFPATCMGCGREGKYICQRCEGFVSEVAFICPVCEQSSFAGERHQTCKSFYGFDGLVSIWEYEGLMKSLLHYIKYNGITHAAKETTERAFEVIGRDRERFGAFLSFLLSQDTFVTYVPMFKKKERKRGFNQAEILARELGKIAGKETLCALEKIHDTKPQVELKKEERLVIVQGAFQTTLPAFADLPAGKVGALAGRQITNPDNQLSMVNHQWSAPQKVVLVDDVWTTGATMKECCRVLKRAGAKEIWGLTIARTP